MGSATKHRDRAPQSRASLTAGRTGRVRRWLRAGYNHLFRIRYRLLLINLVVVAVPIVGIGFARTFETEMLRTLENDMIHQAQLVREVLLDDRAGLRLAERGPRPGNRLDVCQHHRYLQLHGSHCVRVYRAATRFPYSGSQ